MAPQGGKNQSNRTFLCIFFFFPLFLCRRRPNILFTENEGDPMYYLCRRKPNALPTEALSKKTQCIVHRECIIHRDLRI
jgi:hypothetical protein